MPAHPDLAPPFNHVPYNFTYADVTARVNATDLVAGDIGKFSRQLDDESIHMLVAIGPVTWKTIGGGDLVVGKKEIFFNADFMDDRGRFRTLAIGNNGTQNLTFCMPFDFNILQEIALVAIVNSGADGANKDIDLLTHYGALGEDFDTHSESDIATLYDFTGQVDNIIEFDLSGIVSLITAGDYCGLQVVHNGVGGNIDYIGIRVQYTT